MLFDQGRIQMVVYAIKDSISGNWWSHNRWATPTSIPDLYITEQKAQHQIDKGKISINRRFFPTKIEPVIVKLNLTE
jgi:hypothetical protein